MAQANKYDKAKAKAHREELKSIRDALKSIRDNDLETQKQKLQREDANDYWAGDASQAFLGKMNDLESHITATITDINTLLTKLRETSAKLDK